MTVMSGLPPYSYDTYTPIRSNNTIPSIGPSGSLLEAAQFIITAEYRRMNKLTDPWFDFEWTYNPNEILAEVPYEPSVDGINLNNGNASLSILNHITGTRSRLIDLLQEYEAITTYSFLTLLRDWVQHTYPDVPFSLFFPHFRRTDPLSAETLTTDVTVLGGSGVLMDVDFGEIMYNPYPMMGDTLSINTHGPDDSFFIMGSPLFPMFHRPDGSIIDLNGREPTLGFDGFNSSLYYVEPVGSGKMRFDAYPVTGNTTFLFSQSQFFDGTVGFSLPIESTRRVLPNAGTLDLGRAYVTPLSKTRGVYRVGAANYKTNMPNTTVASGVVSTWPRDSVAYDPLETSVVAAGTNFQEGLHVFSDSIWTLDLGQEGLTNDTQPSGLCLLAPKTGHILWTRFADTTLSSQSAGETGDPTGPFNWWRDHIGLEKVGDTIYRVKPLSTAGTIDPVHGFARTKFLVQTYNTLLDYTGEILTDETTYGAFLRTATDIMFDGVDFWIAANGDGTSLSHLSQGFEYIESARFNENIDGSGAGITGGRIAHVAGANFFWAGGSTLRTWTIVGTSPNLTAYLEPTVYTVDISEFTSVTVSSIHDLIEIDISADITPGIWMMAAGSGGSFTADMFLIRVELVGSVFTAREIFQTNLPTPYSALGGTLTPRRFHMIHMEI